MTTPTRPGWAAAAAAKPASRSASPLPSNASRPPLATRPGSAAGQRAEPFLRRQPRDSAKQRCRGIGVEPEALLQGGFGGGLAGDRVIGAISPRQQGIV